MATGHSSPVWPLPAVTRRSWNFARGRGKTRLHAGIDLYAPEGSLVLAPEDGKIIGAQGWAGDRAHALLMQTDSGPVILFGAVAPGSWGEFNLGRGSVVQAGQPVARLGVYPKGDSMLHFEMYASGTRRNAKWLKGSPPPSNLLNPTQYLQTAMGLDQSDQDQVEDDDHGHDDDHHHDDDDGGVNDQQGDDHQHDSHQNQIPDVRPARPSMGPAILALGALFLISEFGE